MTFPTYMLAMTPQKISGCSFIMRGPGRTPWTSSAPMSRAMMTFGGTPSVRRGMNPPVDAELFADSGPATPSMTPVPNFSGYLENLFSIE